MTKKDYKRPPKRKKVVIQASDRMVVRLDKKTWAILERLVINAPPETKPTYSKVVRYCIREIGNNMREKIQSKAKEHASKLNWWNQKLQDYDEAVEALK